VREPSDEQKAAMGMAEQALDAAISGLTWRWILCWSGDGPWLSGEDCAECIAWADDGPECQCPCHARITELKRLFHSALRMANEKQNSWWWDRDVDGKKREEK